MDFVRLRAGLSSQLHIKNEKGGGGWMYSRVPVGRFCLYWVVTDSEQVERLFSSLEYAMMQAFRVQDSSFEVICCWRPGQEKRGGEAKWSQKVGLAHSAPPPSDRCLFVFFNLLCAFKHRQRINVRCTLSNPLAAKAAVQCPCCRHAVCGRRPARSSNVGIGGPDDFCV